MTMTYEQTMAYGAAQYADVLRSLADHELNAEFVQTGGMCAAIEIVLDGGWYLLITDYEDTLSWERRDHRGWWVGLYPPQDTDVDGPLRWSDSESSALDSLHHLVDDVLKTPH